MTPERFDGEILPNLQFSQEDDRKVISGLYAKTFAAVIGCAEELNWAHLGWKCDLRELAPALVMASKLRVLDLRWNDLRGAGVCLAGPFSARLRMALPRAGPLHEALPLLEPLAPTLEALYLHGNGQLGGRIPGEIGKFTKLKKLYLRGCGLEGACVCSLDTRTTHRAPPIA